MSKPTSPPAPNRPGFGMGYVHRLQMEWFPATYGQRVLIVDQVKAERPPGR